MHILDSFALAQTKRNVRPVRTFLTVFICALLFTLLIIASFLIGGIQNNTNGLKKIGYNAHFIATATSNELNNNYGQIQDKAKGQLDADLRSQHVTVNDTLRATDQYQTSLLPYIAQIGLQKQSTTYAAYEASVIQNYHPTAVYHFDRVAAMSNARMIVDGTDALLYEQQQQILHDVPARSIHQTDVGAPSVTAVESNMLQPLVQPGQSFAWKQGEPMPIIVPYTFLVQDSKTDISKMTASQKEVAYKKLIKSYTGKTISYCYRNATAQQQISTALEYNNKTLTGKNAGTLIDIRTCAALSQTQLRTANLLDDNTDVNTKLYAKTPAPVTQTISFKIVGFAPTNYESFDANGDPTKGDELQSFFGGVNDWGTITNPAMMPLEVAKNVPLFAHDASSGFMGGATDRQLFFDFANRAAQKKFIASGCDGIACMQGSTWVVRSFGNTLVAAESIITIGRTILLWAGGVLGSIAMILIMITVGKIISDSRREIAVFRSLGARERDIFQLYLSYGMLLATSIAVTALVLAVGITLVIANRFTPSLHEALISASGAHGIASLHASLFGLQLPMLGLILTAILAAAIIGVSIPVATNSRRNLVQFMKEE